MCAKTRKKDSNASVLFCNSDPIPTQSKRKRIHIQDNAFSENFNEKNTLSFGNPVFQKNFEKRQTFPFADIGIKERKL